MMSALSVRWRITLGSALVAAALLAVVGVAIHLQMTRVTAQSDQTLASSDLEAYLSDLRNNPDETPDKPAEGILVVIEDPAGALRVDTVPPEVRSAVQDHPPGDDTFVIATAQGRYTVVSKSIDTSTGVWQLWGVRSSSTSDLTVAAVDRRLVVGLAAILVIFTAAAWLLTTLALRPVGKMRRAAEALSERPGDAELPVGPARDELSALATTLNSFIRRVRDTATRERQMVSDASHELRTPIAVMSTQLELAHTHFGDAEALKKEILAAQSSLARLAQLAANLLELSRLDAASGIRPQTVESATAAELVTELMAAVDRARMLVGSDRVQIELDTDVIAPGQKYLLSSAAFARIVDNLLVNAARATHHGQIALTLSQHANEVEVHVIDDGSGIPEEFLPHAFERFSQPESSRASGDVGSGLGLALVHAIVVRSEGSVTLTNRIPHGVDVCILIPNI